MEEKNTDLNTEIKEPESKKKEENSNSTKVLVIVLLLLLLLAACLGGYMLLNKKEKEDHKIYDTPVNIDASLATQPLTDAYIKNLDNFKIEADYTNTDPGYTKLINGETDLIIVTEPSGPALERAKEKGVEFEITPVVNEGFVFYTNVKNNVDDLSIEQIQKIYTGEYTNWNQVGGNDANIIAYQRPDHSGSQTGMLQLVMKDLKIKEPTKTEYVETMAGIIDVVSNYENGKDAIGYSYYYYATTMYGNDNMKFFKINGVEPNHDTIKDGSYPLVTSYYIVTLKDNNKAEVKALKEAMLSKKGQKIAREAGYVELD